MKKHYTAIAIILTLLIGPYTLYFYGMENQLDDENESSLFLNYGGHLEEQENQQKEIIYEGYGKIEIFVSETDEKMPEEKIREMLINIPKFKLALERGSTITLQWDDYLNCFLTKVSGGQRLIFLNGLATNEYDLFTSKSMRAQLIQDNKALPGDIIINGIKGLHQSEKDIIENWAINQLRKGDQNYLFMGKTLRLHYINPIDLGIADELHDNS